MEILSEAEMQLHSSTAFAAAQQSIDISAAIVDQSNVGILVLNQDSQLICWNQWMAASSNIPAPFALGKTLKEIFPDLQGLRFIQSINDCLNKGMSSLLSTKLNPHPLPLYGSSAERVKGQIMSQMIMVKPVLGQGKLCMVHIFDVSPAMVRDKLLRQRSSEYRSQEMNTRAILASIGDAVITTDLNGHIDYMNPMAETMTGWPLSSASRRSKPMETTDRTRTMIRKSRTLTSSPDHSIPWHHVH